MTHNTGIHATHSPCPIPYTAEEVARTFADLLATFNYRLELHELGIGSLSIFKRNRAKKRLTALCIALWRVALEKSFPNDVEAFFDHFRATYPPLVGENRNTRKLRELLDKYKDLVAEKKDGDFSKVAEDFIDSFNLDSADRARLQLKLSLRIRSIYGLIFTKLI